MAQQYTDKSDTDLHTELAEKRAEVRQIRFSASGSKSQNPHAARETRKDIARILTELNRRST